MPTPKDLIHETTETTGLGNLTVAAVNGRVRFGDATNGFGLGGTDVFDYFVSHLSADEWEIGTGHMSDIDTLVRDTVIKSSNADAAVNFSAGTKDVTNDMPADRQEDIAVAVIGITIDGAGSAISTGIKGYIEVAYACVIQQVTMLGDQSGSAVVDIWKDTYANYPPVVGDSITAAALPTISGAIKSQDATLTGWTVAVAAGDILGFNVVSAATITRLHLFLKVIKT